MSHVGYRPANTCRAPETAPKGHAENGGSVETMVDGFGRPRLTETGYSGTTAYSCESDQASCLKAISIPAKPISATGAKRRWLLECA